MEKISYTLTLEDCNNYARSQAKIPRLKKYINKQDFNACLSFTIYLLVIYFLLIHKLSIYTIIFFVIIMIIFLSILLLVLKAKRYIWGGKQIYELLSGSDLNSEIVISEANIKKINKNGSSTFNWEFIKEICETKHHYLVFVIDFQAIIIPKRCFEYEEQSKEFYNKIKKYYNDAQKKTNH